MSAILEGHTCTVCGKGYPEVEFGRRSSKDEHPRSWCKKCSRQKRQEWQQNNPERTKEIKRNEYHRHRDRYRADSRNRYLAHKTERNERARLDYWRRREHYKQLGREWYKQNREVQLVKFRQYRAANPEKLRQMNRVYYQRHKDQWQEKLNKNPSRRQEIHRACSHHRRANKRRSGRHYTSAEWQAMCAWFGHVCLACEAKGVLTADHVIPLSRGGYDDITNIQPLCRSCNSRKSTRSTDYRDPTRLAAFLASLT